MQTLDVSYNSEEKPLEGFKQREMFWFVFQQDTLAAEFSTDQRGARIEAERAVRKLLV